MNGRPGCVNGEIHLELAVEADMLTATGTSGAIAASRKFDGDGEDVSDWTAGPFVLVGDDVGSAP
jgi:hypothetical protein